MADLASGQIVPAYTRLAAESEELDTSLRELCGTPGTPWAPDALAAARAQLATTREAWLATEAMWIGPVMDNRTWSLIDWPIDTDDVDALLASTDPLDAGYLSKSVGAGARGLQVIDHLLATAPAEPPTRRCEYLIGLGEVVAEATAVPLAEWTEPHDGDPPFSTTFAEDEMQLDDLVNDVVFLMEKLGKDTDPPLPADDLPARLQGVRAVLLGDGETGLSPLLGDDLTARLTTELEAAEGGETAAIDDLQVTIATEVVGKLGVTIGFSDADGDSAG